MAKARVDHACVLSASLGLEIRLVDYGERALWQLESGRHLDFNIRYCPCCGARLGAALGEIPTSVTSCEIAELTRLAKGSKVLEIGSLFGYSTIQMARVANAVWSVDPHRGYPHNDPRPTLDQFTANLLLAGVENVVVPVVAEAQRVLDIFPADFFDLVFIDCTREARILLSLAQRLRPKWIAVHDYGHPEWTGASEAVNAFLLESGRFLRQIDSLVVLEWPWQRGPE